MEEEKKISRGNELVRFLITGVVCAFIDFLTSYGVLALLNKGGFSAYEVTVFDGFDTFNITNTVDHIAA